MRDRQGGTNDWRVNRTVHDHMSSGLAGEVCKTGSTWDGRAVRGPAGMRAGRYAGRAGGTGLHTTLVEQQQQGFFRPVGPPPPHSGFPLLIAFLLSTG